MTKFVVARERVDLSARAISSTEVESLRTMERAILTPVVRDSPSSELMTQSDERRSPRDEEGGGARARLIRIYVCANFKQDQRSLRPERL